MLFRSNGEIYFSDCVVPDDHLLSEGAALSKAAVYFRPGKIIQAAKNLGVGVAAFERTAEFVQTYERGGKLLIKHQVVASRLADMATRIAAIRSLLNQAALAVDQRSGDADALCNMVKVHASQEILGVCQNAVELHGGMGAMLDVGIEKLYRDATIFLHMDATVDISHFKIIKAMFQSLSVSDETRLRKEVRADISTEINARGLIATLHMNSMDYAPAELEFNQILNLDPNG